MSDTGDGIQATPGPIPPPIGKFPLVDGRGYLTPSGLVVLQQIWAAIQGNGGLIDLVLLDLPSPGPALARSGAQALAIADAEFFKLASPRSAPISASSVAWTPVLAGATTPGAQTYAVQTGLLAYVGPLVMGAFQITLSAFDGTTAGAMEITGIPQASQATGPVQAAALSSFGGVTLTAGYTHLGAQILAGDTALQLVQSGSASAAAPVLAAAIGAAATFVGTFTFFR